MGFTLISNEEGQFILQDNRILSLNKENERIWVTLTPEICSLIHIPENYAACSSRNIDSYPTAARSTPGEAVASPQTPTTFDTTLEISGSQPPKTKWTVAATKALIGTFKDKHSLFDTGLKHDRVYEIICEEMAKDMFVFSPIQVRNRFYNLKRTYNKKKDGLKITGSAPIRFDYWEEFEELFSRDHNVSPICTTSNSRIHIISTEREIGEELPEAENFGDVAVNEPEPPTSRKRAAEQPVLEEVKRMREERKERWEEKKALMEKEMEERKEIGNQQLREAQEGRKMFQALMEKLIEKL